jgi:chromosome segregation ATPase
MTTIFKKALGLFVEFDENNPENPAGPTGKPISVLSGPVSNFNQEELDKFSAHFAQLFEEANLPGPDYYEYWKMMETLESHIPDENARMSAVFASLAIQGLTKQKLLDSAAVYKGVIEKDNTEFEKALNQKSRTDIDSRNKTITDLENKITSNSALIQKLTKEITDAQTAIATLKNEVSQEEQKLATKKNGYTIACNAMLNKLAYDVQKIQTTL